HMATDNWLERWLPLVLARAADRPVLEVGCGHGDDTATLAHAGLRVVAFDLSAADVDAARMRVPSAVIECRDVRDPFPVQANQLGVVVASLSLHYFGWAETVALAQRIHDVLRPGGVLLCRLNSSEDRNFGASGHPQVEPGYFLVDGKPKRFFDEAAVRTLFATGWRILSLEHLTTLKYVKPKALWEVVLERDA
ncbi:MAG: class I SAM-dependent methyltransferase, partial [Ramlibacter sp.]